MKTYRDRSPARRPAPTPHRRTDLPLHPDWADWLWARALRRGEAVALETYGLDGQAHRCMPVEARLRADISAAVASKELTLGGEPCDRAAAA